MEEIMKTWLEAVSRCSVMVLLVFAPVTAVAQTIITSSDILGLVGKSQIIETDTTGSITVNVGSAGTNQTWDFRSVILQVDQVANQFLAPQGTPFAAQFPQANFVQKSFLPSQPDYAIYLYLQVTTNNLRTLGGGVVSEDTSFANFADASDLAPLPLQFGTTWNSTESDTLGIPPTFAIITTTTTNNTVDAAGTVRLPIGDFDCLRIRSNHKTVSKTIVNGIVVSADSTTNIDYAWASKNNFFVAIISSQDDETNPNFTNASNFGRLASLATGVASRSGDDSVPTGFVLQQNFPNPFNPETRITFQLSGAGYAELSVYNLMGEKVRTLVAASMLPGTHSVQWDGRDERGERLATGTYVYRLKAGGGEQSKTMLLLK
jgi:hypothetical protein